MTHNNNRLIILFISLYLFIYQNDCKYCGPTYVRNAIVQMQQLTNCTVVLGNVQIALLDKVRKTDWNISFPHLREITQNLLIYRVHGLETLRNLFPNLAVIRGYKVAFDYALIIFDNSDLVEVNLPSLTSILRGYVRIQKNDNLCLSNLTDWNQITNGTNNIFEDGKNATCNQISFQKACQNCTNKQCSNYNKCSMLKNQIQCHEYCLGGCYKENNAKACNACKWFNDHGKCVEKCPSGRFTFDNYYCLKKTECLKFNRIPFKESCLEECPIYYKRVSSKDGYCKKCSWNKCSSICNDDHVLKDMNSIQLIKGCETLNGTFEISHIKTEQTKKELYEVLGSVKEIRGKLNIIKNDLITSLNFFQQLTDIYGTAKNEYSIIVEENSNLKSLFPWYVTKNLTIHSGKLNFHFNPKLCLSEIETLRQRSKIKYNYTELDISPVTNGNEILCKSDFIDTTVAEVNATLVVIEWSSYKPPPTHIVNGYEILYEISESTNTATLYDLKPCQVSNKETITIYSEMEDPSEYFTVTLYNLRPYTTYNYLITTLISQETPVLNTIQDIRAQSKINQFTTCPDQPSRPQQVQALNISYNQILLKWKPPEQPNGKLTKYVITAYLQNNEKETVDRRDYCLAPKIPDNEQTQGIYTGIRKNCVDAEINLFLCKDATCEETVETGNLNSCENFDSSQYENDYANDRPAIQHPFGSLDLTKRDLTTINDIEEQIRRLPTGEYETYYKTVNATSQELIIDNLLHYSVYLIYISACNEGIDVELCSTVEMIAQRTSAKPNADNIDSPVVNKDSNMITDIYWPEPAHPNCIILYYTIEIVSVDNPELEKITYCVTRKEHQKEKYVFKLDRLPDGLYNVRIQATSLADNGNWTNYISSRVTTKRWNLFHHYSFIFIILFLFVSMFIVWKIFKYRTKQKTCKMIYNLRNFEISRTDISLEYKITNLRIDASPNAGLFGYMYAGTLFEKACFFKVASNELHTLEQKQTFFQNIHVFYDSDNCFVTKLFGIVSNSIPYILAFEYAEEGLLKDYLKKCFKNKIQIPKKYMYQWAAEIADGMAYLTSKNYVHGDLATRNILLTSNFSTKITNFGLGRGIAPENYLKISNRNQEIPIRWVSRELLLDNTKKMSNLSDVWSYGVVLWEIANCCRLPKPYNNLNDIELIKYLKNKGILEPPIDMPFLLSKIMRTCFNDEINRPTFDKIVLLDMAILDDFYEKSFVFSNKNKNNGNTSTIELYPTISLAKIHFGTPNYDFVFDNDKVRLIQNEDDDNDTSTVQINNGINNLNDYFKITPEDWNEWRRAKMSKETLPSFGINY